MIGRCGLALMVGALLVSLHIAFGMPRPMFAQDLFPTPEGRLGGRMPLPTAESLPGGSLPQDTPAPSGHPLGGAWLFTFAEPDRAPAQVMFGNDGLVSFIDADGNPGTGGWVPGGQQSGILAIVVWEADESNRPPQITILQGPIEVGMSGDAATLEFKYTIEMVDGSGSTSTRTGPFTATGRRADEQLIVPTPE
jgi:hypothetical protein